MTHKALSIFNQLRPVSVGFDNVFDHFEQMFEGDMLSSMPSFPHYNIVKTDKNKYDIEIALAGYSKKEDKEETKDGEVIHKGIAKRYFSKSFTIADDVEVKGAELKDGLLKVSMERIIPDHKKPRNIAIK
jgi:molecular chaperone IbpA